MNDEPHPKWRVTHSLLANGWIIQEWDGLKWCRIGSAYKDPRMAIDYMHANAIVQCARMDEEWKLE